MVVLLQDSGREPRTGSLGGHHLNLTGLSITVISWMMLPTLPDSTRQRGSRRRTGEEYRVDSLALRPPDDTFRHGVTPNQSWRPDVFGDFRLPSAPACSQRLAAQVTGCRSAPQSPARFQPVGKKGKPRNSSPLDPVNQFRSSNVRSDLHSGRPSYRTRGAHGSDHGRR